MSQGHAPQFVFEQQLRLEAQRVLDDHIFQRAPMQSQLLQFLVDRTASGCPPPSQYEVAVDGLGKGDDYDDANDSYPRVQMSRLRRNLDNYYARNLPGNGLRLKIDTGSYKVVLERIESKDLIREHLDARETPFLSEERHSGGLQYMPELAVIAAIFCAAVGIGLFHLYSYPESIIASPPEKPSTTLMVDEAPIMLGAKIAPEIVETAREVAELQLRNSFVSKPLAQGVQGGSSNYTVDISFGPLDGEATIFVTLSDSEGEVLHLDKIPIGDSPNRLTNSVEAAMVYITSPTGAIAKKELSLFDDPRASDYACFLSIENRRSSGGTTATLVDDCIELFPESDFRSFWLARRAYSSYQSSLVEGRPISKDGEGWVDLRLALEADPYNAFANFVAARIELALEHCSEAQQYIDRALERGASYPALIAAAEASSAPCFTTARQSEVLAERLSSLADSNPNPDPLLHIYLVVGLLAAGEREKAETVSRRLALIEPEGSVEETSDLLRRSLADRDTAIENRQELLASINLFVWNAQTADKVVDLLVDG